MKLLSPPHLDALAAVLHNTHEVWMLVYSAHISKNIIIYLDIFVSLQLEDYGILYHNPMMMSKLQ